MHSLDRLKILAKDFGAMLGHTISNFDEGISASYASCQDCGAHLRVSPKPPPSDPFLISGQALVIDCTKVRTPLARKL
jgi:hypothetical protein